MNDNAVDSQELDSEQIEELKARPQQKAPVEISHKELNDDAKKRAKKQPLLQKIAKAMRREKPPFRELIINSEGLERRVALLEDGVLGKFEIERRGDRSKVGAIYKGKIQNLEAGLKAAFVDIGEAKNAFLHYWDILPSAADSGVEIVRENQTAAQKKQRSEKISLKDIPKHYPIGTDIVIQITKAQINDKGPRTTTNIAIPGRYMVLMPYSGQCGISRKIEDRKERDRLKKILRDLTIPEGMGVIVRTAGEGKQTRYFVRDLYLLLKRWNAIQDNMSNPDHPPLLYEEPNLIERTVRDFLTEDIDRILIDDDDDFKMMQNVIAEISPRSKSKVNLFEDNIPIFERFNIERQIEQTFMRRVPLPSGGEIVIEETEALTAIDVNTGSHRGANKDGKDYIFHANMEAAREITRQIRLRNIGGLIIADFIDMKNRRDRKAVYDCVRREMANDKAKCHVLPISTLGIMQMSRQRHKESTSSGVYASCPYCYGRGTVKAARTMSAHIQRRLVSIGRKSQNKEGSDEKLQLRIFLHPTTLERMRNEDKHLLLEIEKNFDVSLSFRADHLFHIENFKIVNIQTGEELA